MSDKVLCLNLKQKASLRRFISSFIPVHICYACLQNIARGFFSYVLTEYAIKSQAARVKWKGAQGFVVFTFINRSIIHVKCMFSLFGGIKSVQVCMKQNKLPEGQIFLLLVLFSLLKH